MAIFGSKRPLQSSGDHVHTQVDSVHKHAMLGSHEEFAPAWEMQKSKAKRSCHPHKRCCE